MTEFHPELKEVLQPELTLEEYRFKKETCIQINNIFHYWMGCLYKKFSCWQRKSLIYIWKIEPWRSLTSNSFPLTFISMQFALVRKKNPCKEVVFHLICTNGNFSASGRQLSSSVECTAGLRTDMQNLSCNTSLYNSADNSNVKQTPSLPACVVKFRSWKQLWWTDTSWDQFLIQKSSWHTLGWRKTPKS